MKRSTSPRSACARQACPVHKFLLLRCKGHLTALQRERVAPQIAGQTRLTCAVQQGAARASQGASAKLMRFAAALKLEAKHRHALVQTAIARNMAIGNYG